jgi:hypothetical protein
MRVRAPACRREPKDLRAISVLLWPRLKSRASIRHVTHPPTPVLRLIGGGDGEADHLRGLHPQREDVPGRVAERRALVPRRHGG